MFHTQGIILKKNAYREYDEIFTIYTRDFGKIEAIARGVKKPLSKLNGHLQVFDLSNIEFALGKKFKVLTGACLLSSQNFSPLSLRFPLPPLCHCEGEARSNLPRLPRLRLAMTIKKRLAMTEKNNVIAIPPSVIAIPPLSLRGQGPKQSPQSPEIATPTARNDNKKEARNDRNFNIKAEFQCRDFFNFLDEITPLEDPDERIWRLCLDVAHSSSSVIASGAKQSLLRLAGFE